MKFLTFAFVKNFILDTSMINIYIYDLYTLRHLWSICPDISMVNMP